MIPALNVAIGLIRRAYCVRSQTAQSFCSVTRTASLFRGLAALGGNPATPGYELSQSNASIYQKKVEESAESQVERRLIDGEKGSQIEEGLGRTAVGETPLPLIFDRRITGQ
ncbi:unnamed protein product [Bursaphelenchus xylophilus]|uniref:(pine wood nematode) hypothetical protein n=1 Tax=Bursaphelenchus xylophilus TaxID=6326 RepID=A0A7I8X1E8_BURXY|nr:unnamed protein product [Bursaphelenchus xylophilus]CAG9130514.1 unnamed protein product [Bursaphelenchus xylophilus]